MPWWGWILLGSAVLVAGVAIIFVPALADVIPRNLGRALGWSLTGAGAVTAIIPPIMASNAQQLAAELVQEAHRANVAVNAASVLSQQVNSARSTVATLQVKNDQDEAALSQMKDEKECLTQQNQCLLEENQDLKLERERSLKASVLEEQAAPERQNMRLPQACDRPQRGGFSAAQVFLASKSAQVFLASKRLAPVASTSAEAEETEKRFQPGR